MAEESMTYGKLTAAGTEKYCFPNLKEIAYPEGEVVEWHGYRRHNFVLEGRPGFIVEPPHPAVGLPWSWCIQWAEAFVPRTPALQLLDRGFHHVFFDVFSTYMNEEGMRLLEKFYAMLQNMHFHKKAALIGMSYGGLFSLRWAAEHPDAVGAIYLDAPLCSLSSLADRLERGAVPENLRGFLEKEANNHFAAFKVNSAEGLRKHPLNPMNNYLPIAEAKIPILAIRSGQDQSVLPEENIDLLAEKLKAAGGKIEVIRRDLYGHHPHGLDDPTPLTGFILQHYPDFEI